MHLLFSYYIEINEYQGRISTMYTSFLCLFKKNNVEEMELEKHTVQEGGETARRNIIIY